MRWARETGVIPGALVGMKATGARIIASVTFIAIPTIPTQATTAKLLAKKLGALPG